LDDFPPTAEQNLPSHLRAIAEEIDTKARSLRTRLTAYRKRKGRDEESTPKKRGRKKGKKKGREKGKKKGREKGKKKGRKKKSEVGQMIDAYYSALYEQLPLDEFLKHLVAYFLPVTVNRAQSYCDLLKRPPADTFNEALVILVEVLRRELEGIKAAAVDSSEGVAAKPRIKLSRLWIKIYDELVKYFSGALKDEWRVYTGETIPEATYDKEKLNYFLHLLLYLWQKDPELAAEMMDEALKIYPSAITQPSIHSIAQEEEFIEKFFRCGKPPSSRRQFPRLHRVGGYDRDKILSLLYDFMQHNHIPFPFLAQGLAFARPSSRHREVLPDLALDQAPAATEERREQARLLLRSIIITVIRDYPAAAKRSSTYSPSATIRRQIAAALLYPDYLGQGERGGLSFERIAGLTREAVAVKAKLRENKRYPPLEQYHGQDRDNFAEKVADILREIDLLVEEEFQKRGPAPQPTLVVEQSSPSADAGEVSLPADSAERVAAKKSDQESPSAETVETLPAEGSAEVSPPKESAATSGAEKPAETEKQERYYTLTEARAVLKVMILEDALSQQLLPSIHALPSLLKEVLSLPRPDPVARKDGPRWLGGGTAWQTAFYTIRRFIYNHPLLRKEADRIL